SAFAHKGGVHVSAVSRHSATYEHVDPKTVGNERRILVSELSGRSNVLLKSRSLEGNEKASGAVLELLKKKELEGYHFEGAEASFELLVQRALGKHKPAFSLDHFRVEVESGKKGEVITEATVKLHVGGRADHTVGEGDGPVNALDNALRKSLEKF